MNVKYKRSVLWRIQTMIIAHIIDFFTIQFLKKLTFQIFYIWYSNFELIFLLEMFTDKNFFFIHNLHVKIY